MAVVALGEELAMVPVWAVSDTFIATPTTVAPAVTVVIVGTTGSRELASVAAGMVWSDGVVAWTPENENTIALAESPEVPVATPVQTGAGAASDEVVANLVEAVNRAARSGPGALRETREDGPPRRGRDGRRD